MEKQYIKRTKENKKEGGKTPKSRGETFYEAIPTAATAPKELELPKINAKTADFLESIIIFFAGTVLVLLFVRVVIMIFGINGGNLLTYLLYATSYPFVLILSSGQSQVPAFINDVLYENIAIMVIYSIVFYGILRIIRVLRVKENNN